ncbi:FmdB family zinc ribbon protein [Desulfosarcina cetonica]|uniref:FmdB family zinc ribbon protein n=1 Tax=Desulfosarcina cetonica TaxID=90730 RepID=UPI0006D14D9E|nr:zinc ribbon domain-containing protein [Desulfosarcina cetonica]
MPLFDYLCADCGHVSEILVFSEKSSVVCPQCGGSSLKKMMSAHSSLSGTSSNALPGPGDTACCGSSPGHAGCAGPGSCCGKA